MPTFPTLSTGSMRVDTSIGSQAIAMFGSSLVTSYLTKVVSFLDDSEQRWTQRGKLFYATLSFKSLNGYDLSILRGFFVSQRGMHISSDLSSTFDITLGGVNYKYCVFDQDVFQPTVDSGERYSVDLRIRQIRPN